MSVGVFLDKKQYSEHLKITNQVGSLVHQTHFFLFGMMNEITK